MGGRSVRRWFGENPEFCVFWLCSSHDEIEAGLNHVTSQQHGDFRLSELEAKPRKCHISGFAHIHYHHIILATAPASSTTVQAAVHSAFRYRPPKGRDERSSAIVNITGVASHDQWSRTAPSDVIKADNRSQLHLPPYNPFFASCGSVSIATALLSARIIAMLPRIRNNSIIVGTRSLHTNSARPASRSITSSQAPALRSLSRFSSSNTFQLSPAGRHHFSRSPTIPRQLRHSTHSTQGSYHSPTSANQTLLSDVPAISPRSLVKHLDTYVVGQTKAKKVLAVGVWNHYLRVASNQRMKEEAELRLMEQEEAVQQEEQTPAPAKVQDKDPPLPEAHSRSIRLGKYEQLLEASTDESWKTHIKIQEERKAERVGDPHGQAARNLMFGRGERKWLVNAGGSSAIVEDDKAATRSDKGFVPKFGDNLGGKMERVPVKTPAEEASLSLEQGKTSSSEGIGGNVEEKSALAEAARRMHKTVLSDYTPKTADGGKERGMTANIGIFGDGQPLYFSSNTLRTMQGGVAGKVGREEEEVEKKWKSPQERATYAAGLAEERMKRALKLARERLSSATNASTTPQASSGREGSASASAPTPEPTLSSPAAINMKPSPPTPSSATTTNTTSFISTSPGTLPFFEKSNILLLGPSGSGKTLLLRTLAQVLDVPFVHVDATPLTMAGYVGEDVESIIQRLLVQAGWDINRAQRGIVCIDEIDKLRRTGGGGGGNVKDVGGEGVQQALLRVMEGTTIQVSDKNGAAAAATAAAQQGGGAEGAKVVKSQQEMEGYRLGDGAEVDGGEGGRLGPWYNHRKGARAVNGGGSGDNVALKSMSMKSGGASGGQQTATFNVDTSSILFVLSGAFVGIEDAIRKRLTPTSGSGSQPPSIPPNSAATKDEFSQSDLLNRLEPVDLEQYGLIPEFIGRVPVSVVLNPLSFDDLVRVMTEPKNSLVDQYTSLFKLNGIDLHISPGAIEEVVHRAMGSIPSSPGKSGGGGARSLRRIMEEVLLDAFYESYGTSSVRYILVDQKGVREGGVKLFSRGQRFDFEAQVQSEAKAHAKKQAAKKGKGEKEKKKPEGKGKEKGEKKEEGQQKFSAARLKAARLKARAMVRARFRLRNRLSDPVIYI